MVDFRIYSATQYFKLNYNLIPQKMKKLLLIAIVACLSSCEETMEERQYRAESKVNKTFITIIDSCEYLSFPTYNGSIMFTHKGNCKFCKERNLTPLTKTK